MAKRILIRPIITEKTEELSEKLNKYSFVVDKSVNKIEIKEAIEAMFPNVTVSNVNTMIMPKKQRSRMTKKGVIKGRLASFKKAVITIAEGDELDFYGEA